MKALVVYYSKTGNTKRIAEQIAEITKSDIFEIREDEADRSFKDFNKNQNKDPANYDLVIVGGPVWAFNICPPVKNFLTRNKDKIKRVAFFCTYGGMKGFTFGTMKKLSKNPIATLAVRVKNLNRCDTEVRKFCTRLI